MKCFRYTGYPNIIWHNEQRKVDPLMYAILEDGWRKIESMSRYQIRKYKRDVAKIMRKAKNRVQANDN